MAHLGQAPPKPSITGILALRRPGCCRHTPGSSPGQAEAPGLATKHPWASQNVPTPTPDGNEACSSKPKHRPMPPWPMEIPHGVNRTKIPQLMRSNARAPHAHPDEDLGWLNMTQMLLQLKIDPTQQGPSPSQPQPKNDKKFQPSPMLLIRLTPPWKPFARDGHVMT